MNIRNRNLTIALVGLGLLGVAGAANAQTSVAQPIRVEIGGFFPTDSGIKNTLQKVALQGGVSYDIYNSAKGASAPYAAGLYVDVNYNSGSGLHLTTVGVGVQGRVYASGSTMGNVYLGAGVGAYFINENFLATSNKTELGGKVFVGYELTQGFFVEGGYTFIPSVNGTNTGGFDAVIGYKF